MQTNAIIHNIIRTSKQSKHINLLSDNTNSLFDHYIDNIANISFFGIEDHELVSSDLIFSNNPIRFSSQLSELSYLHLNSVTYFHTPAPHNFKKEDKFLLKNALSYTYKVFASTNIMHSWGFNENDKTTLVLPYGLTNIDNNQTKIRSVVVLNTNNNPSVNTLYNYIVGVFKDAILITDNNKDKVAKALSESAICIETESYFNIIEAIKHKCLVISALNYLSEDGLYNIESYSNINQIIYNIMKLYDDDKAHQYQKAILSKYSDILFQESFFNIVYKVSREPYIYVKNN